MGAAFLRATARTSFATTTCRSWVGAAEEAALALGEQTLSSATCDVRNRSGASQSDAATPDFWLCGSCRTTMRTNGPC